MIEISIKVADDYVLDQLDDKDCNLEEVAVALLRLKQIEQILIDKSFNSKFEMREEQNV